MIRKFYLLLIIYFTTFSFSYSQYNLYFNNSIPAIKNSDTLSLAWAGGLNVPQFSSIDLNGDGIKDLYCFDRAGNKSITLINTGTNNIPDYHYAPQYQTAFPKMHDWVLLADYNCDGKEDIFTYSDSSGITVYRNDYNTTSGLQFTLVSNVLYAQYPSGPAILFANSISLPTIVDIDGDGNLDIINFEPGFTYMNYFKNQSLSLYGNCDSLKFDMVAGCWGEAAAANSSCLFSLNQSCRIDAYYHPTPNPFPLHGGGGNLLALDLNGDNAKEMLIGDIISDSVVVLNNGGDSTSAHINSQSCSFPTYDTSVYIENFPACFYLDVNNDGKRDLIVAPGANNISENTNGIWYFRNDGTDASPLFHYQTKSFLQSDMIEVGEGSNPVFFDYDHDGLMDLVIGNYGYYQAGGSYVSGLSLYKNVGTNSHPVYQFITNDYGNLMSLSINLGLLDFRPAFGDIDGDGFPDMIVGDFDGNLLFCKDTTTGGYPAAFGTPVNFYQTINVGPASTPQLIDVNRDGLMDLIIGNRYGRIYYYQNTGTATNPIFTQQSTHFGNVNVTETGYVTGFAVPFMFDSAGSYRLAVGCERGYIYYYNNIDGNLGGTFNLVDSMFNYHFMNGYQGSMTSPFGSDIDGDWKLDLVVGNLCGGIQIHTSIQPPANVFEHSFMPDKVIIYPNPSDDMISFINQNPSNKMISFKIFDLLGQEIISKEITPTLKFQFSTSKIMSGIYIAKISLDNGIVLVKKLVIQH